MKRKLNIYLPFINAGLQESITYKVNWFFMIVGNIAGCFVSYFIWNAVFLSSENGNLNGFTMPQMVVYIFVMFLTTTLTYSDSTYGIGEEIRDGSISMRLIKPISYNATFLFKELGSKFMTICALITPLVLGVEICSFILTGGIQFDFFKFILYLLSCTFAYLINFYFNICFGFIAFVLKQLWGASMLKNCVVGFLSGTVIPLNFLPNTIENILLLLPFSSLNYTPVMIYLGIYNGLSSFIYLSLQLFWVLFFCILSKMLWKVAIKHLCIQGG